SFKPPFQAVRTSRRLMPQNAPSPSTHQRASPPLLTSLWPMRFAMPKKDREAVNQGLSDIFGTATDDLLSNVIQSDRRRAGRQPEPTPVVPSLDAGLQKDPLIMTSHTVSAQYDNMTNQLVMGQSDSLTGNYAGNVAGIHSDKPAPLVVEPRQRRPKANP